MRFFLFVFLSVELIVANRKIIHGMSGSELTRCNFDKKEIIKDLIKNEYNGNYKTLLGEL